MSCLAARALATTAARRLPLRPLPGICRPWRLPVLPPALHHGAQLLADVPKESPGSSGDEAGKAQAAPEPASGTSSSEQASAEAAKANQSPPSDTASAGGEKAGASPAEGQKADPGKSGPSSDEEISVFLEPGNFMDILTTPLRHGTHLVTLSFVSFMVPLEWSWSEFSDGAEQAVAAVHDLLGKEDYSALRDLLAEPLLEELRSTGNEHSPEKEGWAEPPRLIEVDAVAVFSSRAMPGTQPDEAPAIRVTPLMKVLEEYHYTGEAKPRRYRRLVKWEFERTVRGDGPSAWQVCGLGKHWFMQKKAPGKEA